MSDVINNPVAGNSKTTLTVKDANNTWKLLLGLFAILTVACLIWLVNSLSSVSQYLTNFNQSVVLPVILFVIGVVGILFALYQLLKQRGGSERLLIEKETLRRRQEAEAESERARQIQEENERNQIAILRLLDELGDLTVNATVSEDFTGAIADSVNFAIDQLRQLVLVINSTADRVSQSSEQTQMNAVELAEASENQAQEIAGVSAAINEMTVSIDQVSNNAAESATVAQRSVAISYNGAEVVQRSIEGMNVIRDQIQETSKRIKRLGESSQEIGDIVGLINDIADQTNVLALNAAIQASMAGEAGRGFAVVADEVQRLAERSANATKQIETLVKTIQADTNEAVMSMESTTSEVVRGARLAKDAGEALEEVQSVSNTLADLIQNISNAAQQQAESAGHISHTMNIIQDITSQTSSGTMATARSIGELSEMAAALQESVTGFKVSNDDEQLEAEESLVANA
ncbi:methyl-accepting chemotaxis protein [Psychrobacter sp. CAL495-MNA-CIBAN-0180]|uniref:methyl-accepting chemotaxis protein n=1 Tax=Psychrobacter sp. CAL495-MNA-CIBAN-0180 TaxID=3140454 RepID=UPI003333DB28